MLGMQRRPGSRTATPTANLGLIGKVDMRNIGSGRTAATVVLVGLENEEMGRVRETLAAEAVLHPTQLGLETH